MAYNEQVADRVRTYLSQHTKGEITEKKMFGGLAFLINDKMCINVSGENLMCRFNPSLIEDLATRPGFLPMTMKGKQYQGYGYVEPAGFSASKDFAFWVNLCLDFNDKAKSSKK